MNVTGRPRSDQDRLTEDQDRLLSKIDLIAHIVLRDTTQSQTLEDILQAQLFSPIKSKPIDIFDYRNVILLCDGLDEVSFESGPILDVVNAKCYPGLKSIVTCRPHAALGISLTTDSEIRLKGFNVAQAKHYVDMYFHKKFNGTPKVAQSKSNKAWKQIELSPDLLEMSTNPSMLQLMCLIYCETGRMGKDRDTLFRDYTFYLLNQYHLKHTGKTETTNTLNQIYKYTLIKIGHLALQGLQQSHLQLVFTKDEVMESVGDVIFKIGFLTEIPSFDRSIKKVQFLHKTLQEYLGAYAVVNSSNQEGLQLLMKFCSTSRGLMGSQMILTFITAMSKKMGKVIQRKIQDFVSSWTSDDDISPKDRVSFLITMLKENKSLEFPLPETIHINLKEYETFMGALNQAILHLFNRKTTIERFFSMDSRGVKYVKLALGKSNRLELIKTNNLEILEVDFENTYSEGDVKQIVNIIKSQTKPGTFIIAHPTDALTLGLINNNEFLTVSSSCSQFKIQTVITEKIAEALCQVPDISHLDFSKSKIENISKKLLIKLIMKLGKNTPNSIDGSGSGINIDTELVKCISELPEDVQIDLSGNKLPDESLIVSIIKQSTKLKSVTMRNCGIKINKQIAEAVSELNDDTKLDLSGNEITKMEAGLLGKVLKYMKLQKELNLSGFNIDIDDELVKCILQLPEKVQIDLSDNKITDKSLIVSIIKHSTKLKSVTMRNCGIEINKQIAEAVSELNDDTKLDLSGNEITKMEAGLLGKVLKYMKKQKEIDLSGLNINIDSELVKCISELPEDVQIDLSGNKITQMEAGLLGKVLKYMKKQKEIDLSGLNINIDSELVKCILQLPEDVQIDLSDNKITDKSLIVSIIKHSTKFKSVTMRNCGIKINKQIAEAVSELNDDTKLDLSGNKITQMEAGLLGKVLKYMKKQEEIDIGGWGITIDVDIVKALSNMVYLKSLLLSYNTLAPSASKCLVQSVRSLPQLEYLRLGRCDISNDDCVDLVSSLSKHCPRLRVLDLNYNHLSSGYSQVVDDVSKMNNLRDLGLYGNPCMKDRKKREEIENRVKISNPQLKVYTGY